MPPPTCKYNGCYSSRGLLNGYCRIHKSHADPPTSPSIKNRGIKNEAITSELEKMMRMIHHLQKENVQLTNVVDEQNDSIDKLQVENQKLKIENGDLKKRINLNFLSADGLNQYGRKECARLLNSEEGSERKQDNENAVKAVKAAAQTIGIELADEDIQRCHRIGKFREGKRRPIIVKFRWYKKRMEFIKNKKKLKPNLDNMSISQRKAVLKNSPFIAEDLSPYRGKVFRFIKDYNRDYNLFEIVTTHNGLISCKKKKDDPNWINISSSQDFIEHGIPRQAFEDKFDELLF